MKEVFGEIRSQILILATLVGLMWGLEILDVFVFRHGLDSFGILPRNPIGLRGIFVCTIFTLLFLSFTLYEIVDVPTLNKPLASSPTPFLVVAPDIEN